MPSVSYGERRIDYAVIRSGRKTLAIAVSPDRSVTVRAPNWASEAEIAARVEKRAAWIVRQQHEVMRFSVEQPPREYVAGETHHYLGRRYRLRLVEHVAEMVKLDGLFMVVQVYDPADRARVKQIVTAWYRKQARRIFNQRLQVVYPQAARLAIPLPKIRIQVMRTQWGSCTAAGMLILNLKLVQVPVECIDYVILHELAHLKAPNHGAVFKQTLTRLLPGWERVRDQLNEYDFG